MRKHARNVRAHPLNQADRAYVGSSDRLEAMRALGPVVYAARVGELVKIGHTADLPARLRGIGCTELLAFVPGTRDDEQALHRLLADHVHHGREWYYPTPGVVAVVNDMRAALGLDELAA